MEEVGGIKRGVGETFGVAALLLGASKRKYGMRATERCLLLRLTFERLVPFLHANPSLEVCAAHMG